MEIRWEFLIPAALALAFAAVSTYADYYLIFAVLLFANVLNWKWGEFNQKELGEVLTYFYRTRNAYITKAINAIVLLLLIVWGIYFVDSAAFSTANLIGFSLTVGLFTGCFLVTLGHDLLHSSSRLQRFLSILLFTAAGIPHFATEHICGHHREVGLEQDPTTAKLNESFYAYFFKVTYFNIKNNYFTQYGLPVYLRKKVRNANLKMVALLWAVWLVIYVVSEHPAQTLTFFIVQGLFSYFLYELINYIQHYGLHRNGKSDKIGLDLSWNSYYKYTNYILFLLPLHSLHHLPKLERKVTDFKAGPKMPYLYFMMILLAMIPPLWFRKMNGLIPQKHSYELS